MSPKVAGAERRGRFLSPTAPAADADADAPPPLRLRASARADRSSSARLPPDEVRGATVAAPPIRGRGSASFALPSPCPPSPCPVVAASPPASFFSSASSFFFFSSSSSFFSSSSPISHSGTSRGKCRLRCTSRSNTSPTVLLKLDPRCGLASLFPSV